MGYTECRYASCGNPVFSAGSCRKHYERERLETSAPCSVSGCSAKAFRGILCAAHYREQQKNNRPLCTVPNCGDPQKTLQSGLCEKHLFRFTRHGSVEQPRNSDWGSREQHPLYKTWCWHKRVKDGLCSEWRADFWVFVATVFPKPQGYTLRRPNSAAPLGPDNWFWKKPLHAEDRADRARKQRAYNPRAAKNSDLKKMYGITIDDFDRMAHTQDYCCAICSRRETAVDKFGLPRRLAVDHCHVAGKVRALLCTNCNKSLGGFRDDPALLRTAAEYLEGHRSPLPPTTEPCYNYATR